MRVRPEALHRFPGGLLAAAIVMAGCARAAPVPVACVSPRLVPSALMVGDGALDRGFPGGVSLVDVDGDGDLDLFVQERTGELIHLENTGTREAPRFTWRRPPAVCASPISRPMGRRRRSRRTRCVRSGSRS